MEKGRKKGEKLKTIHYQLAASLQKIVENTIINMIFNFNKKLRFKNICLGGGVFMNSVMNGKIAENFSNNEIFIPYAPDDSGNSIGVLCINIFPLQKKIIAFIKQILLHIMNQNIQMNI